MQANEGRKENKRGRQSPDQPAARMNTVSRFFDHFAAHITKWAGSPVAFGCAAIAVLIWAACGPAFGYSETWQLVINTGTTIVTFLMVFLIQQSQNKDGQALHLKLDELLIALKGADEGLVDAERLDEDELLALAAECTERARKQAQQRKGGQRREGAARSTLRDSYRIHRRVMRARKAVKGRRKPFR